jgi:hypothetical protein
MISHPTQEVKISTADPSAIGLFGLAMVTWSRRLRNWV